MRINPRLSEFLIPVEWREAFRDRTKMRETLKLSSRAFSEGRAVVIFPSGRIAYWKDGRLERAAWQSSAITLARKQDVPIVPVNVQSRNSGLFYWFANWNTELRDMTVFHELLNKRGKTFRIRFGPLIPQERFAEGDAAEVTQRLQAHVVERLAERSRRGVLTEGIENGWRHLPLWGGVGAGPLSPLTLAPLTQPLPLRGKVPALIHPPISAASHPSAALPRRARRPGCSSRTETSRRSAASGRPGPRPSARWRGRTGARSGTPTRSGAP